MSEPAPTNTFQFPKLDCGETVRVSFDRAFSRPMMGIVNIPKGGSANIVVWDHSGRANIYPDCRHREDPYLAEHPAFIGQPGHAIFELTTERQERDAMKTTIASLTELVQEQAKFQADQYAQVEQLRQAVAALQRSVGQPVETVRRPVGRPRKETVEV